MAFKNKARQAFLKGYSRDKNEHILLFSFVVGSCSAPDFICYKNDSLCDVADRHPTNISIVVFWSSVPILQDKRTVTSNCKCKEVTFTCHIAIEDNIQGNFGVYQNLKVYHCYTYTLYMYNIIVSHVSYKICFLGVFLFHCMCIYLCPLFTSKYGSMEHTW